MIELFCFNLIFEVDADLESNLNFETSMRQFYSIPGSSVPNGQEKFLDFCYGNLTSEKNISVY